MAQTANGLPIPDTAGTGISVLERVVQQNGTFRTVTRSLVVMKLAKGTPVSDLEKLLSDSLAPNTTATGLVLVCGSAALFVSEQTYEATAHMFRKLAAATNVVLNARVVASIEDCPTRLFGPLAVRTTTGTPDAPGGSADGPVKVSLSLYQQIVSLADRLASDSAAMGGGGEAGRIHPSLLDGIDRYASLVPLLNEGKLDGIMSIGAIGTSVADWLGLYAGPVDFDPGHEMVLPLPARVPY